MDADVFSQSCRLHNIRDSWQDSVQCLVEEVDLTTSLTQYYNGK